MKLGKKGMIDGVFFTCVNNVYTANMISPEGEIIPIAWCKRSTHGWTSHPFSDSEPLLGFASLRFWVQYCVSYSKRYERRFAK